MSKLTEQPSTTNNISTERLKTPFLLTHDVFKSIITWFVVQLDKSDVTGAQAQQVIFNHSNNY